MTAKELYDTWAPPSGIWSAWVKPVLFAYVDRLTVNEDATIPSKVDLIWAPAADGATAIVIDLPGDAGVWTGAAFAALGYRPIPLYNAIPEPVPLMIDYLKQTADTTAVHIRPILLSLVLAAPLIAQLKLNPEAPPTFILDANRRGGAPLSEGDFDNRSISLPTDFPSANLLLSRGIKQIVLVQSFDLTPQADLSHTLRRWQEAGLHILSKSMNDVQPPQLIDVRRPQRFRILMYNFLATMGFMRSRFGGFGGRLPMPSSGSAG